MKLSKSKLALAKVINENGGWVEGGEFAAQDKDGEEGCAVWFYSGGMPHKHQDLWYPSDNGEAIYGKHISCDTPFVNWHQTVLSREEYYQADPKADYGWIEWGGLNIAPVKNGVNVDIRFRDGEVATVLNPAYMRWSHHESPSDIIAYRLHKPDVDPEFCESVARGIPEPESIDGLCAKVTEENKHQHVDANPTIDQLAQDYRNKLDFANRKQQEADDAKAASDAALGELELAGEALGIIIGIPKQDSATVIIDWRDLKVGDEIRCVGDWQGEATDGLVLKVDDVEMPDYRGELAVRVLLDGREGAWGKDFEFISRK